MMFWISTLSYLWRNTSKRWLESPIAPLSKIILTALFGLATAIVFVLFRGIEREVELRLLASDVTTVFTTEVVYGKNAATVLLNSYEEESLWQNRYGKENITFYWRAVAAANSGNKNIPIIAYSDPAALLRREKKSQQADLKLPPTPLFLTQLATKMSRERKRITLLQYEIFAPIRPMPAILSQYMGQDAAVLMPLELAEKNLKKGFILYTIAHLSDTNEVSTYLQETRAYYAAEKRKVQFTSAESILADIEHYAQLQKNLRVGLAIGCGLLLAIILGAIAWLEFREDRYLLALLRSFGISAIWLFIHTFLENFTLVILGVLVIRPIWSVIAPIIIPQLDVRAQILFSDHAIHWPQLEVIAFAGLTGCLLAMLPIAISLKKKPGLILQ